MDNDVYDELFKLNFDINRRQMRLQFNNCRGIHPKQMPMLDCIERNPGITQCQMAAMLFISTATVGVSVKRMAASGLITVKQDKNDLRVTHLEITETGRKMLDEVRESFRQLNRVKLKGFTSEQLAQYKVMLEKIRDNLERFEERTSEADK